MTEGVFDLHITILAVLVLRIDPELFPLSEEAEFLPEMIELRIVEIEEVYDEESEAGLVLSQSPQPGEFVERGGTIEVSVSLGPDLIAFPSVPSEMTFEEAQQLLSDAGFTVELTLGAADGTVEEITIEGEEPSAGDEFPNGTQVDIVAT